MTDREYKLEIRVFPSKWYFGSLYFDAITASYESTNGNNWEFTTKCESVCDTKKAIRRAVLGLLDQIDKDPDIRIYNMK